MEKRARRLLARKLRLLRFLNNWSQEQLAQVSSLDRSYVSSIERAERNVSLDNIEKLADAFDITPAELLRSPDNDHLSQQLPENSMGSKERKES
ncbi:MAG: hypothetical protein BMS9Abin33_0947 [Gammaproteobacteria bacterium]|nr:MAG: hypothetical protein BMS9Abin33_0947 [Gammaproteobacteria bacterium]